jgi:putative intracellular protease/amidase
MTNVLQVMTSHDQLGDTGRKTGYWASELTHAYREFERAGYEIELASIRGGTAPLDPLSDPGDEHSMNREDQISAEFYSDPTLTALLANTAKLAALDPDGYDVVYFTGGAGAMWDFPDNPDVIAFVRSTWEAGKIVSAVCHGVAALCNVTLAGGGHLISGRELTGFSNAEEHALEKMFGLPRFVPFYLQDRLIERGGHYQQGQPFAPYVAVSGNLLTGQQPASGQLLAKTIIEQLRSGRD